jgi:hypothetical protein
VRRVEIGERRRATLRQVPTDLFTLRFTRAEFGTK